ncbi:MAG: FAD-dependent oxidoreductase [Deltaproteobacteria bacterium]|nr:FAD-dependent oxidoreductase [Deltaproteobacteria bacterium]
MREYVILGTGPAGRAAALEIRGLDPKARVTLVTREFTPFYLRPALADYVAGSVGRTELVLSEAELLNDPGIEVRPGCRAYRLFPHESRVLLSEGTSLYFDALLLATGSTPRAAGPGAGSRQPVATLSTLSDAVRLSRSAFSSDSLVLVAGEGHTGLETVRAFAKKGCRVTYLTSRTRFWNPRSGVARAEVIEKLRAEKIEVLFDETILDVLDLNGEACRVVTSSRQTIDAQLVCDARELAPAVEYLEGSGVVLDHGVVVDLELRTNFDNIFAAGDVAQVFDSEGNWHRVNFGWLSAARQGRVAGHNLVKGSGRAVEREEPFFSELYGTKLLERWGRG